MRTGQTDAEFRVGPDLVRAGALGPLLLMRPTLADLAAHCKASLAGYKAPKHLVLVERIVRSPSGKADYRWARDTAEKAVGG